MIQRRDTFSLQGPKSQRGGWIHKHLRKILNSRIAWKKAKHYDLPGNSWQEIHGRTVRGEGDP